MNARPDPHIAYMSKDSMKILQHNSSSLSRQMGLLGLVATGICSMIGAGVNVIPFMIQRNVPGIGPHVLKAYAIAAVPAILAALAYAILASAMPRAGGSYMYASRAFNPFLGFIASFSQWFGLSIAMGVVAYLLVPFLRDISTGLGFNSIAETLEAGGVRVTISLALIWIFTLVNLLGIKTYERIMVALMLLMFIGGAIAIPAGLIFNHSDFAAALAQHDGVMMGTAPAAPIDFRILLAASAVLFSSFIGFDSISQAGSEAKNPNKTLPLAIGITVGLVATYYMLFTGAIYHAVPWYFIAERGVTTDLTAPGLLGYVLAPGLAVAIIAGAAIALANSLPGMILAVSRLMFAWAEDGVFPNRVASVNKRWRTPHVAILISSITASAGIMGCHLAGDFFLGVDILITSMLINFLLMCLSVLTFPRYNPVLAKEIRFVKNRRLQVSIGSSGAVALASLLVVQVIKDLQAPMKAWYFHSTYMYLIVTGTAALVFMYKWQQLRRKGVDLRKTFSVLPPE